MATTIEIEGKCPRCVAEPYPASVHERGAPSRATMDGRDPQSLVCSRCRLREVHAASKGLRPIRFEEWPVSLKRLAIEDEIVNAYRRQVTADQLIRERERSEEANRRV